MSCGEGHGQGSDPMLPWCRLAAVALTGPLPSLGASMSLRCSSEKKRKRKNPCLEKQKSRRFLKPVGRSLRSNRTCILSQNVSHRLLTNYQGVNGNFIVEKSDRYHLKRISTRTIHHHVPCDVMHLGEYNIAFAVFQPKGLTWVSS